MGKSANTDSGFRKLVAYIRCTEAIADTRITRCWLAILLLYCVDPARNMRIGKSHVFALPCFVVKVRIAIIMAAFAMLPYWILFLLLDALGQVIAAVDSSLTPRK